MLGKEGEEWADRGPQQLHHAATQTIYVFHLFVHVYCFYSITTLFISLLSATSRVGVYMSVCTCVPQPSNRFQKINEMVSSGDGSSKRKLDLDKLGLDKLGSAPKPLKRLRFDMDGQDEADGRLDTFHPLHWNTARSYCYLQYWNTAT